MEATWNIEEIMAKPEAQEAQQKLVAALEADEAASKAIEETDSVEGLYDLMKGFLNLTLEKFKKLVGDCYDYCAKKMEIADEDLDIVAGGGLGSIWNKAKSALKYSIVATCTIVGGAIGVVGGAIIGTAGGQTVLGGIAGGIMGGYAGNAVGEWIKSKL